MSGHTRGMDSRSGSGMAVEVGYSVLGFRFSFCLFWRGSAMEGPGLSFRGREASLVQPRVPVSRGRQARGSRQRASLPPVFQFSRPTRRGGWVFSRCRHWFYGDLRRERRGRFFKGRKARVFRQGSYMRAVPVNVVDLPSPGWAGKGHGTRWDEEMALFACAATCPPQKGGRLAGRPYKRGERYWDGLGR